MPNTCKTANDTPETDAAPLPAGGVGYEVWLARQIESLRERHGATGRRARSGSLAWAVPGIRRGAPTVPR